MAQLHSGLSQQIQLQLPTRWNSLSPILSPYFNIKGGNFIHVAFGYGLALMVGICVSGGVSGGSLSHSEGFRLRFDSTYQAISTLQWLWLWLWWRSFAGPSCLWAIMALRISIKIVPLHIFRCIGLASTWGHSWQALSCGETTRTLSQPLLLETTTRYKPRLASLPHTLPTLLSRHITKLCLLCWQTSRK